MNLKFDIQGIVDGKPGRFTGRIDGFELADSSVRPGKGRLFDPAEPNGGHALDDPDSGEPAGAHGLDDPAEPGGAHQLDDPAGNQAGGWLDHPGRGPLRADCATFRSAPGEPVQALSGVPSPSRLYSGFILVRLSPLIPTDGESESLEAFADTHGLQGLKTVLGRFGGPPSRPAVGASAVAVTQAGPGALETSRSLEDLERRAAASDFRPRHSLRAYWRLDGRSLGALTPAGEEVTSESGLAYSLDQTSQSLIEHLNALSEVDLAYRELLASDPDPELAIHNPLREPSTEELSDFQLSLSPAPLGLNAQWARNQLRATDGPKAGAVAVDPPIALADLEQGWNLRHQDLPAFPADLRLYGKNRRGQANYGGDHGTAVLGQLIAKADNRFGVVGIAEGVAKISLASHYRAAAESSEEGWDRACNGCVAEAIKFLMTSGKLGSGSVLLLEVQRAGQPVELDELDFDAIRLATASGILVVEAAGNGGLDLDRLPVADGRSLDRRSSKFQDSGALMVGAAWPALPHDRASFSNYGSRVDCFAWGGGVTTAGFGDFLGGTEDQHYTDRFSGTSSAAAMIAGAAALVQALYQENAGSGADGTAAEKADRWNRLSPRQLRSLLSSPAVGTPQGPNVPGAIGVMPDLRKVLDDALGIVPRVYLRDHEGDDGGGAGRPRRFSSPDIVVGRGPGRKVALQVRNRGLRTALQTKATLYCAPVLTLLTPDRWGLPVGGAERAARPVPQGDVPLSIESSAWRLESGDHCLIATVEYEGGDEAPGPCRPSAVDWPRFLRVLREQKNLAIRNVHSISAEETAKFSINGTPDVARVFSFELLQRLPWGVSVELTAPLGVAAKFSRGRLWKVLRASAGSDSATLHLPKLPRLPLGTFAVPPSVDFGCSFVLLGEKASVQAGHSIALRQLFKGEEVGRITWEFRC